MIKKVEINRPTVTIEKYCDECGAKVPIGMQCSVARCEICQKDLCDKCVGHESNTMGDYREVYCKACWDIGEKFRNRINECEQEIDDLNEGWRIAGINLLKTKPK